MKNQIDESIVKNAIFCRPSNANKGTLGSLLSICGSYGMAGAAIMAGKSALKCGLGLLKCALPKSIYNIAAISILESVFYALDETKDGKLSRNNIDFLLENSNSTSAVLLGCGLSKCADTKEIVYSFIENCTKPMVLDADALNCVCDNVDILKKAKSKIIVTPHPGEMARLINKDTHFVNSQRENITKEFSKEYGVVTVLKGKNTVVSSINGNTLINPTGNSGMATGGSGDVLAGMISSILAQGANPFDSACAGVYLHGLSGDIAKEKFGEISMLPSDIIDSIYLAYKKCGF